MNGQIIITVTEHDGDANVNVDVRMRDVDTTDKMILLHSMIKPFEISQIDLMTFVIAERAGVFEDTDTVRIDRGAIEKVLGDHP
jgi:hypothetical protein